MQGLEVRICDDTQEGDLKRSEKQDMSLDLKKKKSTKNHEKKPKTSGSLTDTITELAERSGKEWVEELVFKFSGWVSS